MYRDGTWFVVIKRKFVQENTSNPDWGAGKATFINFAVWDGANNERGARKSLEFGWTPLTIEEK
jgi:DMSO reductase family type II enzyme heme b subunit